MKRFILLFLACIYILTGCSNNQESIIIPDDFALIQSLPSDMHLNVKSSVVTIGMIGDILLHHPLYTYDNYDFSFSAVKDQLTDTDFLIANQESLPGGVELELSGYPLFNSPKHIIRDLKANGVDLLSIANNHTLDRRDSGLLKAISHMEEYGMPYVGAYKSREDRETKRIFDVKDVRVGVLSYTYSLNGLAIPKGKGYLVSMIDEDRMAAEIKEMREEVDLTVVSIHWGEEYSLQPSARQEELATWMAEQGVDIIFGHHPHVLQKHTKIGNTEVFYSLGNFYSAQQFESTNIGGIAKVHITTNELAGKRFMEIDKSTFFPTAVVRDNNRRYVVIPLKDAGVKAIFDDAWASDHVGLLPE